MWKVGSKNTMMVACNPKSNFPISIELRFGGPQHTQEALDKCHGMWFGVEDAKYLISELEKAINTLTTRALIVDDYMFCSEHQREKHLVDYEDGSRYECPECQRERGDALGLV